MLTAMLVLISSEGLMLAQGAHIGSEVAIAVHLQNGDEFTIPLEQLIDYGRKLFTAKFTIQEGAGRPLSRSCHLAQSSWLWMRKVEPKDQLQ